MPRITKYANYTEDALRLETRLQKRVSRNLFARAREHAEIIAVYVALSIIAKLHYEGN